MEKFRKEGQFYVFFSLVHIYLYRKKYRTKNKDGKSRDAVPWGIFLQQKQSKKRTWNMEIKFIPKNLCALKHRYFKETMTSWIIFPTAQKQFLGLKYLNSWCGSGSGIFLTLDPGWKNLDPGSGISIPDPKHWFLFFLMLVKSYTIRLMHIRVRLARCKTSSNESVHLAGSNNLKPTKTSFPRSTILWLSHLTGHCQSL